MRMIENGVIKELRKAGFNLQNLSELGKKNAIGLLRGSGIEMAEKEHLISSGLSEDLVLREAWESSISTLHREKYINNGVIPFEFSLNNKMFRFDFGNLMGEYEVKKRGEVGKYVGLSKLRGSGSRLVFSVKGAYPLYRIKKLGLIFGLFDDRYFFKYHRGNKRYFWVKFVKAAISLGASVVGSISYFKEYSQLISTEAFIQGGIPKKEIRGIRVLEKRVEFLYFFLKRVILKLNKGRGDSLKWVYLFGYLLELGKEIYRVGKFWVVLESLESKGQAVRVDCFGVEEKFKNLGLVLEAFSFFFGLKSLDLFRKENIIGVVEEQFRLKILKVLKLGLRPKKKSVKLIGINDEKGLYRGEYYVKLSNRKGRKILTTLSRVRCISRRKEELRFLKEECLKGWSKTRLKKLLKTKLKRRRFRGKKTKFFRFYRYLRVMKKLSGLAFKKKVMRGVKSNSGSFTSIIKNRGFKGSLGKVETRL